MKTLLLAIVFLTPVVFAESIVDGVKEKLSSLATDGEYDVKQLRFYNDAYSAEDRLLILYRNAKAKRAKDGGNGLIGVLQKDNSLNDGIQEELNNILSCGSPKDIRERYLAALKEVFRKYDYQMGKLDGIQLIPNALGDAPKRMQAVRDEVAGKAVASAPVAAEAPKAEPKEKPVAKITIKTKDGKTISASSIIKTETEYVLKTDKGMVTIKKDDVEEIKE